MRANFVILVTALVATPLAACGQKGPLTLPPPQDTQQSKPAKPESRPFPDVPSTSDKQ
jgi:predicted small lipoprotein YifL